MKKSTPYLISGAAALLVLIDQVLKLWVLDALAPLGRSVPAIPGLLQLTYVENRGAAFGIFQGRVGILSIVTFVVVVGFLVFLFMGKFRSKSMLFSICLIIAGGLGNLVDRVWRGFVVDYLDISPLFSFPVFNFADCCVVVGTFVMLIYLLFFEEQLLKKQAGAGKVEKSLHAAIEEEHLEAGQQTGESARTAEDPEEAGPPPDEGAPREEL